MTRLVQFSIRGLLGQFHHSFSFPPEDEFLILHGPNGVGKTRLLEIIDAILGGRLDPKVHVFDSAHLEFDDGETLEVSPRGEAFTWRTNGRAVSSIDFDERTLFQIARNLISDGLLRRSFGSDGSTRLRDAVTGEHLSEIEAAMRFNDSLPESLRTIPAEVAELIQRVTTTLIEVDRVRAYDDPDMPEEYTRRPGRDARTVDAVTFHAKQLGRTIMEQRAEHAIRSQELDQSYAGRLLESENQDLIAMEVFAMQQGVIEAQGELQRAGVIESLPSPSIDISEDLQAWQLGALKLHYSDTKAKIDPLLPFARKINLFTRIVSDKLLGKRIRPSAQKGFEVLRDDGESVALSQLSSGEKHQLIMTFRLVFDAGVGHLVLIDEPEISLHVRWQREFLQDLCEISRLNGLRSIVATHSPQVISGWDSRLVPLGSIE